MYFYNTASWLHRWTKGCTHSLSTDFSWNYYQHCTDISLAVGTVLMRLNSFKQKSRNLWVSGKSNTLICSFGGYFLYGINEVAWVMTAVSVSLWQHRDCRVVHTGAQRFKWAEDQFTHWEKTGKALRHHELTSSATPPWLWRPLAIQLWTLGHILAHRSRWGKLPPHFLTTTYLKPSAEENYSSFATEDKNAF